MNYSSIATSFKFWKIWKNHSYMYMVVSGGNCNVYQGLGSNVMLSWMFTPSFNAIGQLQKLCRPILLKLPFLIQKLKGGCAHFNMHIFTFNWLTLTSEMHFVKFHPEVSSCLLSRGKRKYAPLGMRLLWKYIRNYFLVYHLISHFLLYLHNHKEFEPEILDLQLEKYELSFDIKKYTTSGWALGDENVIGIRSFKFPTTDHVYTQIK